MTCLYFFFFLLLAGLFGGIGIFYRNKGKKPADSKAEERRPLLVELGRSLKSWSVAACAPVPAAPRTPIAVPSHPAGSCIPASLQAHPKHSIPASLHPYIPASPHPCRHIPSTGFRGGSAPPSAPSPSLLPEHVAPRGLVPTTSPG